MMGYILKEGDNDELGHSVWTNKYTMQNQQERYLLRSPHPHGQSQKTGTINVAQWTALVLTDINSGS